MRTLLNCEDHNISCEKLRKIYFDLLRRFHPDRSGSQNFAQNFWQLIKLGKF